MAFEIIIPAPSFSIDTILAGQTVTIPLYQQMIVSQQMTIHGNLKISGTLVVMNG